MDKLIPEKESLTVEFKSDRKRLADRDLVEAVVCLANTSGGEIYLGVENDGTPTGVHLEHRNLTGLAALIANRTISPISVRVEPIDVRGVLVVKIAVPRSIRPVSTSDGVLQRRRPMANGTPQCVPFYPHEFIQREAALGVLDYSAMTVSEAESKDFDPLERERLRQMISRYGGDSSLTGNIRGLAFRHLAFLPEGAEIIGYRGDSLIAKRFSISAAHGPWKVNGKRRKEIRWNATRIAI